MHSKTPSYIPGILLLAILLIAGFLTYQDYGISWDEAAQQELGKVTYEYAFHKNDFIKTIDDRRLGTGFELPLTIIERNVNCKSERDIFLCRHLVTHIFFLLGAFCMYVLALKVFKKQLLGILAFIMVALEPRMYAHSFMNTKDIPFLTSFIFVMLACYIAFNNRKPLSYLVAGIAVGYACAIRGMGMLFVMLIAIALLIDIITNLKDRQQLLKQLLNTSLWGIGFCGMLYLSWPMLWETPVHTFKESFLSLAGIPWSGEVLFNGKMYGGNALPWNYMPVWLSISIPELWVVSGYAGIVLLLIAFVKKPVAHITNTPDRHFVFYLACFLAPPVAMHIFHGANIDDWRHLYFIYPPFVMLGLYTINKAVEHGKQLSVILLSTAQLALLLIFMISSHPNQQVYFNYFVSHDKEYLRKHYDYDYWCCSFTQGVAEIAARDPSPVIKIAGIRATLINAMKMLSPEDAKRIQFVQKEENPDYFLTVFRMHPDDYEYKNVFYEIKSQNSTVMRIYKLKP